MSSTKQPVPKCVADTIPEDVKELFGVPPKIEHFVEGLEEIYKVAADMTSWGMGTEDVKVPELSDSDVVSSIEHLYDFVYFRRYEMPEDYFDPALSFLVDDMNDPNLIGACESLLLLVNFARLQTITQLGTPNLYAKDQEQAVIDASRKTTSINAVVHFIQLAHVQQRLEFGTDGTYVADPILRSRMATNNLGRVLFTNQEAEFLSSTSETNVYNGLYRDEELHQVSSNDIYHWTKYSRLPDYLNPRVGKEIGTKTMFLTLPSLQSWLAKKSSFRPTQFVYEDRIPNYTDPGFFKKHYAPLIHRKRIRDDILRRKLGFNDRHIARLKKGNASMFYRQALLLDNLIYQKVTGEEERRCFPTYHELSS